MTKTVEELLNDARNRLVDSEKQLGVQWTKIFVLQSMAYSNLAMAQIQHEKWEAEKEEKEKNRQTETEPLVPGPSGPMRS